MIPLSNAGGEPVDRVLTKVDWKLRLAANAKTVKECLLASRIITDQMPHSDTRDWILSHLNNRRAGALQMVQIALVQLNKQEDK